METTEKKVPAVRQDAGSPEGLIRLAIEQNADVDKLERLVALHREWQAGIAKKEYLRDLSRFQSLCPVLTKTKSVSFGDRKAAYKYVPLSEIVAQIKDVLRECNLTFRWETKNAAAVIEISCVIAHVNGHSERNTMSAGLDTSGGKNPIQQQGSTITYLQRYTLIGALGISSADEDVDGAKKDTREELTPEHPKWQAALDAFAKGSVSMKDIEKKYKLSKTNLKAFTT